MDLSPIVGIVLAVVAVWLALLGVFWLLRPRGASMRDIMAVIPDLLRLIRSLIRDRAVPADVRIVLVALLAWIVSPVDLIPEFIPGLGPLDDVIVAIVALRYVCRRVGVDELRRRWTGSDQGLAMMLRAIGGTQPAP